MSPRPASKTSPCDRADAQNRLAQARKFLEVARLVAGERGDEGYGSVAGSLAVLAGIAAADASTCAALGVRSRSRDHRDAVAVVERIAGKEAAHAAQALRRLIDIKDTAQYGVMHLSAAQVKTAVRQAQTLIDFAEAVIRRL